MKLSERFEGICSYFEQNMTSAASELVFASPYQLLVAVMLSAQCTDRRVNMTTPELFKKYPGIKELSEADYEELLDIIKSISYPRSKATHLIAAAKKIMECHSGEIPGSIEELMSLPGVGRKTANVVSSILWDEPVIAVDTHVFRVARRTGLSSGSTPEAVERDLERHIPPKKRPTAHHWLILHGRYVCTARKPKCDACGIALWCKEYSKADKAS